MSETTTASNKRIAKNTLFMYFRMLITMAVGLYASRIVLATLGASDYGLYNVVGGIVVVLASINGTLATGTQRFLSFALGENDENKLKTVFSNAVLLHLLFAAVFLIVAESAGLWFLDEKMNIPEGRENAAFWVFQFSIIATVINIIQVPFMSAIIAHERLNVYAYMSIFDAVGKLFIVYLIQVVSFDKLILYSSLICAVGFVSALIYNIYCHFHFCECRLNPKFEKTVFNDMAKFSGWNLFGCIAFPLQTQGVNILLNIFFNTIVNAARGIAVQVNNIIIQFVDNFQIAVNPQIIKTYASGKKEEMILLVINNSKFAGFLYLLIAIPIFVEIEFVLNLWLGEYPYYTIPFIRIILIQSLIQTLAKPVTMAVHAVGKMKGPNLTGGIALLLIVPTTYLLLKQGLDPVPVFIVNLIPWFLVTFFNLCFQKKYIGFPILRFYKNVYCIVFPIAAIIILTLLILQDILPYDGWLRFITVSLVSVIFSGLAFFYLGVTKQLRQTILKKVYSYLHHQQ